MARAEALDKYLETHENTMGPLHGFPISLKDCFNIKGIPSTIGFVSFIGHGAATRNSGLVETLLGLGAVLYVKTNLPQTIMTADTDNNIFGRTLNPHKASLTVVGSSGGEGVLMALRGSILGVGTDIAGSVRIPALCYGIYGFRSSLNRVPYGGQKNPAREGMVGIAPGAGPLATNPGDIEMFWKAICDSDAWQVDETALFAPWRQIEPKTKLRLGFLLEDASHPLHLPTLRTIKNAVSTLAAAGHTVIELKNFPSIHEAKKMAFHYFGMDPAGMPFADIPKSGEPWIPSLSNNLLPKSEWIKPTIENLYDWNEKRDAYKALFRDIIVTGDLDAILMPGNAGPASPYDTYGLPLYTVYLNFLDYTVCVIPNGVANETLDKLFVRDVNYLPAGKWQRASQNGHHIELI